jgi:uridine kinase
MRPVIIGIGGAHSGAGKTTIASLILKRLKGWGAIKKAGQF